MTGIHPAPHHPGPQPAAHYVLLSMDTLRLLIPQNQVRTLEPGFEVRYPDTGGTGWIEIEDMRSPVYCLSRNLEPLVTPPASRNVCVLLESEHGLFGVLCDQVAMFGEIAAEPLPKCMRSAGTPIRGLALHGEQVLCIGSAAGLLACLEASPSSGVAGSAQPLEEEMA